MTASVVAEMPQVNWDAETTTSACRMQPLYQQPQPMTYGVLGTSDARSA